MNVDPKLLRDIQLMLCELEKGMNGGSDMENHCGLKNEARNEEDEEDRVEKKNQPRKSFMQAYRLSGEAKVQGAIEFLDTLFEAGEKFLLFAHHISVLDLYQDYIQRRRIGFVRIDGRVSAEKRYEMVTKFQNNVNIKVAILGIQACSQGITLTAASTVVFAELTWTPSMMSQAEDRVHRIGQQNCVSVYYLYGPDTIDDHIFKLLSQKTEVIADSLDGGRFAKQYDLRKASQDNQVDESTNKKENQTEDKRDQMAQGQAGKDLGDTEPMAQKSVKDDDQANGHSQPKNLIKQRVQPGPGTAPDGTKESVGPSKQISQGEQPVEKNPEQEAASVGKLSDIQSDELKDIMQEINDDFNDQGDDEEPHTKEERAWQDVINPEERELEKSAEINDKAQQQRSMQRDEEPGQGSITNEADMVDREHETHSPAGSGNEDAEDHDSDDQNAEDEEEAQREQDQRCQDRRRRKKRGRQQVTGSASKSKTRGSRPKRRRPNY